MNEKNIIRKENVEDILDLTRMQQGMLYHYISDTTSSFYQEQISITLKGKIDIEIIKVAWNNVVETNEMLRTVFKWDKLNKPVQIVLKKYDIPFEVIDLSRALDIDNKFNDVFRAKQKENINIQEESIRIVICKINKNTANIIIKNHHILYDGWSNGIIIKEFIENYNSYLAGKKTINKVKSKYKNYIKSIKAQNEEVSEKFWRDYLSNIEQSSSPIDESVAKIFKKYTYKFPSKTERLLESYGKRKKVSSATILYGAWGILQSKYLGRNDVIFGSIISGRTEKVQGIDDIVGLFINTVPLRIKLSGNQKVDELIKSIDKNLNERLEYENTALVDIKKYSGISSKDMLFDTIMVIENYPLDKSIYEDNLANITDYKIEESTNFNLTIELSNFDNLEMKISYNSNIYDEDYIENMAIHYENIINQVVQEQESKNLVDEIEMLSEEEKRKILVGFNDTKTEYSKDKTINQLFEEQVEKTPDDVAVVYEDKKLTYRELNEKSNSLAGVLREKGVKADSIVGIMVERSLEMMVGIIGILKAGGAYLPIDSKYPQDRIEYMLEDCESNILLSTQALVNNIIFNGEIIDLFNENLYQGNIKNLEKTNNSNHLAYVIYTSGTTGAPKGVMIEHKSVVNLAYTLKEDIYSMYKSKLRVALVAPCYFDASVQQIFVTLFGGYSLYIIPEDTRKSGEGLLDYYETNRIDISDGTPIHLSMLANSITNKNSLNLKHLIIGGDCLEVATLQKIYRNLRNIQISNVYGPTECCVDSTILLVESQGINNVKNIPIGKPISNSRAYILDPQNNKLMPIGTYGELCVSGDGLARGYLNRPELTAEKFVLNPYEPGEKMYRTGDLARWLPDGNIEFLGRIDYQVKIRGYRIELGEIENQLLKNEEIKEAVVVDKADKDGNKYLCAYVVSNNEIRISELRGNLSKVLPDYMVPSYFMQVEKMTLTSNGKIDRKALPEPDREINTGVEYVEPRNEIEEKLVKVWSEILGVEKIGIDDDFFTLGGHSLKAIQVISMIHKELNVEVPVSELFSNQTIRQLGEYIEKCKESVYFSINAVEEREVYKVSSAQKRLFALNQFGKEELNYNMPAVMIVEGKLEKCRVEETFRKLVERHEAFRTSFKVVNEEIVQRIHKDVEINVEYEEISEVKEDVIKGIIGRFIRTFDLSKAPLLRVKLVGISKDKHILMIDMHHIVSDGTTIGILIEEFAKIYKGEELEPLRIQYKDYAEWENELLDSEYMKKQEEYWMKVFSDEIPVLNMPTDYARPTVQSFEGDRIDFKVDKELAEKIRKIGDDNGATMYMTLLSAYNILLARYSGQEDIIVGSPIAGRNHAELEGIVGMFVNTLAMRNYPKGEKTFKGFLQSVKENALKAYENQDYQFDELVDKVQVRRELSRNALFDTMFVLQNMEIKELEIDDLKFEDYDFENKISKFDLTLTAEEMNEEIGLNLEYCTRLFKKETVEKIGEHFLNILREIAENEDIKISEIEMLSEEEKRRVLVEFNDTKTEYPKDKTIHELFEEQVEKTPDNIALVYEDKKLTYRELNEKSNSLARILREKGVKPDSIVGIMVEKSVEMIIGIMGILKAGGAYLPIDPKYPQDRIEYMLEDCASNILLSRQALVNNIIFNGEIIDLFNENLYQGNIKNLEKVNNSNHLAYVIYTSGTTGAPKGVMCEHKNIIRLVKNTNYIEFQNDDKLLQTGSMVFDASTFEVWGALLNGIELFLIKNEVIISSEIFEAFVIKNNITIMWLTSELFNQMVDSNAGIFKGLRYLLVGGDVLTPKYINLVRKECNNVKIINGYGPTENTTFSTTYLIQKEHSFNIPIGNPISNSRAYILDPKNNRLMPIGTYGELCVSGDGLARGYLNRPELTAEKFVSNPYEPGERMYKTGDLTRWLPDGNIEFLGRIDKQVKIRGFRIELGEIENHLLKNDEIREAVVVDKEDKHGNKYLCAYIVSEKEMTTPELRGYLSKVLPDYMVPSYFMQVEKMPLTSNGKIDRKALPEPDGEINTGVEYVEPRNEIEEKLVKVWSEVLGAKKVGINDDFFSLGGDSIKAIQVTARLKERGYSLEIKNLFKNPTIKGLANYVKKSSIEIYQGEVLGEVKLTPIQKWFFEEKALNKDHFNQAVMIFNKNGFKEELVGKAFNEITKHHDALRMVYSSVKGINKGIDEKGYDLYVYDLRGKNVEDNYISDIASSIQKSIKLSSGPLVKLGLFKTNEGDHLLIAIHHMVIDGVSWRILFEDFNSAYSSAINNEKIVFPLKTTSFKEWSEKQTEYVDSHKLSKEIEYWNKIETTEIKRLPKDMVIGDLSTYKLRSKAVLLNAEHTNKLLKEANKAYSTEVNDLLLAALGVTIGDFASTDNVLINLEAHGREEIIEAVDITRTIGWFTTQYPVILKAYNDSIGSLIKNTKDRLRRIPNKGIGYGILKYLSEKNMIENKLNPEINFNYLGQFDEDISGREFEISRIYSGESISLDSNRIYPIEISAIVREKELNISITYSNEEYLDSTIENFLNRFKNNIIEIIDHCVSKKSVEITAADITKADITLEELKNYETKLDNIQEIYRLSPMQEGMLFHFLKGSGEAYHLSEVIKLKGVLDIEALEKSFKLLVEKYDVFRTNFDSISFKENMQIVYKTKECKVTYKDIRTLQENKDEYIKELIAEDRKRGFDLTQDLLIRLIVVRDYHDSYSLILSCHHIIIDGWCLGIIINQLFKCYNEIKKGKSPIVEKVIPYGDYIKWINGKDKEVAINYWKKYLDDYNTNADIPFKKEKITNGKSKEIILNIDKQKTKEIEALARRTNVTINSILQSIWAIQLQRYNNANDVVFGFVVSGRTTEIKGIESMVGLFINTIPLRVITSSESKYIDVIKQVKSDFIESEDYNYCSLAEVQNITNIKERLINSLMVFENYPIDEDAICREVSDEKCLEIIDVSGQEETNFNLYLKVLQNDDGLAVSFSYNDGAYDESSVKVIKNHYSNILNQIIKEKDILIRDIEIVDYEEKQKILVDFNDTKTEYQKDKTIHELFEEQVEKTPDNIAVIFKDKKLTYRELNEKANSLARILRKAGVEPDTIVGIMVEKSLEMIIGIMGILKAGGAYLPIDPKYPQDRIKYMLQDSETKILLTQEHLLNKVDFEGIQLDIQDENVYSDNVDNLGKTSTSKNLAYLIYTSGSTGNPKGVMVEHYSVINRLMWMQKRYPINVDDIILQKTTYTFDVSVWELLWWSLVGARVCLLPQGGEKDLECITKTIECNKITVIHFVPSMLNMFMDYFDKKESVERIRTLKQVFSSGEALSINQVKRFNELFYRKHGIKLSNLYGPTEATVDVSFFDCSPLDNLEMVPIGKPIDNIELYVLDKKMNMQPIGIPGELCISGDGLARGYLNKPELTAEKFIESPFVAGERIYRTGDLARWMPDGNIEYLGRIDHQVKIRGFRIELGEIESQLLNHEEIKESIVIDREDENGAKYLCAYLVSEKELTVGELRAYLSKRLPEYMIPSYFMQLDKMPLTPNGKIDRKALLKPDGSIVTGAEYEKPRNAVDEKLIKIWSEVLGVEKVGINDNFFELGGHSLKVTTVVSKMHKELNVEVPLREIFKSPTIKEISEYIQSTEKSIYSSIEIVEEKEYYEASSAQKRMYMLQQFDLKSTGYNMPGVMLVEGCIKAERLEKSFVELIRRHETLRTSFETIEDKIVQRVNESVNFKLNCFEVDCIESTDKAVDNIVKDYVKPFNLNKAPLLRVGLIKLEANKHILMFDMHHIISDGVSMGILINEFAKIYEGNELEKLRIQYKDYSALQNSLLNSEVMQKQKEYWINRFKGEIPVLNMPTDFQRPLIQSFEGENMSFKLDKELTKDLNRISKETGSTMYMVLLSGVTILLSKYSGQEDVIVGSPIAGRPHADLEKIIGIFVNTLAMRNHPEGSRTYEDFLNEVKKNALKAYENQDYQFDELVDKLNIPRDISRNPLFDVMFTMQNLDLEDIALKDLIFKGYNQEHKISKFDLTFTASEVEDEIVFDIEYSTKLFIKDTIEILMDHLKNVFKAIANDRNIKLNKILLLNENEFNVINKKVKGDLENSTHNIEFNFN